MAVSNVATFVKTPKLWPSQILPADGTAKKNIVVAGADGSKVVGMEIASTDNTIRYIQLSILRGGITYNLNAIGVPIIAGTDTVAGAIPPVSVIQSMPGLPADNDGNKYLFLLSGDTLQWNSGTAVTAGKQMDLIAIGGDF